MKKKLIVLSSFGFLAPLFAFAQSSLSTTCTNAQTGTIQFVICEVHNIVNVAMPVLVAIGVLFFVWGVVQYVIGSDEEAKKKGKDRMIYGIIGLVVIVAMWGLVGIITNTFGLNGNAAPSIPTVPLQ